MANCSVKSPASASMAGKHKPTNVCRRKAVSILPR